MIEADPSTALPRLRQIEVNTIASGLFGLSQDRIQQFHKYVLPKIQVSFAVHYMYITYVCSFCLFFFTFRYVHSRYSKSEDGVKVSRIESVCLLLLAYNIIT